MTRRPSSGQAKPIVVFAVGNPSRGDDAIGPECYGQLEKWLKNANLSEHVELIEDFQLNIEHALDLQGRQLAIFIDAGENTPAPYEFRPIFRSTVASHSTHALPPESVLQVYWQMEGEEPPASLLLCVRGESFELGADLSTVVQQRLPDAIAEVQRAIRQLAPVA